MVIVGQFYITSEVTSVGCKEIQVTGQLLAPRGSEAALSGKISKVTGQVTYYTPPCRFVFAPETYGKEFLEMLQEPTSLMVFGPLEFENDVTSEVLKAKVKEITAFGPIRAPKRLIPTIQFLCVEVFGPIEASDGDESE